MIDYKGSDRFVRTKKVIRKNAHTSDHIERWSWIGEEGKTFAQISAPDSGYRKALVDIPEYQGNTSIVNHHLTYDIKKVGMIALADSSKFGKDEDIVVKTKELRRGQPYKRDDFRDIHGLEHPSWEYWNGIVRHKNKVILWDTLNKKKSDYKYNDQFKDGYFYSDAQNNNKITTPAIMKIRGGEQPLLFCRIDSKSPFTYFGPLEPIEIDEDTKPIRIKYKLLWSIKNPSKEVKSIIEWTPENQGEVFSSKPKRKVKNPKNRGRKAEDIIPRAEIYKVEFEVEGNKYVYVGQDSKCQKDYYGSSLIMFHYENVFGAKIFNKTYLEKGLKNIKLWELNQLESKHIREEKIKAANEGVFSINHTGENQRIDSIKNTEQNRNSIIKEANILGLELKVKSAGRGVIGLDKSYPHLIKGIHLQTNKNLNGLGFAFNKTLTNDKNLGLARQAIREIGYEPIDSIDGSYSLVMAMHELKETEKLAQKFKDLVDASFNYFK